MACAGAALLAKVEVVGAGANSERGRADKCCADWPSSHAGSQPVPLYGVRVSGGYLGRRIERNLQSVLLGLETRITKPFKARAAGEPVVELRNSADSDVYKWLEGASYVFVRTGDAELKKAMDRVADVIIQCQQDDGYINTQLPPDQRFFKRRRHDLYIAGHFFEAAVAHHRATGERNMLDAAQRWADFLIAEYEKGNNYFKKSNAGPHNEYELGLLRLYRETGQRKYLAFGMTLAEDLNDIGPKVADVRAGGDLHAVRVGYMLTGRAGFGLETGDEDWLRYLPDLLDELVETRMYVTGGMGSRRERISEEPYDLPQAPNHELGEIAETCGSIAMAMFCWRMHAIAGDSRYFDVIETIVYNHVLGAAAFDCLGTFYYNPMRVVGDQSQMTNARHRPATARRMLPELHGTSCCITNLWRFLGALPEYIFSYDRHGVFVNLYTSGAMNHTLEDGRQVALSVETDYPHAGDVRIRFEREGTVRFKLRPRIPGWCEEATAEWPGQKARAVGRGEYLEIDRTWTKGDTVRLRLEMPVRMILPDERIEANAGQVVFGRGPILFCLEKEDVPFPVKEAKVAIGKGEVESRVKTTWHPETLDGIHMLHVPGRVDGEDVQLRLVPWSVRANRSEDSRWVIFLPLANPAGHTK